MLFSNKLVSRKICENTLNNFFWSWFHVKFVKIKKFHSCLCSNFREITNLDYVGGYDIFVWCSYKLPLEEGYVENWSVVVHKLEEVYFECQSIIEASLRPVKLLLRQTDGEELVNVVEHHDEDQVNWGPCGSNEYGVVFP